MAEQEETTSISVLVPANFPMGVGFSPGAGGIGLLVKRWGFGPPFPPVPAPSISGLASQPAICPPRVAVRIDRAGAAGFCVYTRVHAKRQVQFRHTPLCMLSYANPRPPLLPPTYIPTRKQGSPYILRLCVVLQDASCRQCCRGAGVGGSPHGHAASFD